LYSEYGEDEAFEILNFKTDCKFGKFAGWSYGKDDPTRRIDIDDCDIIIKGAGFEGNGSLVLFALWEEDCCSPIVVEFMDEYGNTRTEDYYNPCPGGDGCFGLWVNQHTEVKFGWTLQGQCLFDYWMLGAQRILDGDCNVPSNSGTITLTAKYNCPVDQKGCMSFTNFMFDVGTVPGLFPEGRSVFRYDASRPNDRVLSADPIIRQLFQLPSVAAARNATLNYIEITKDNTPLYLTYVHEGAGWYNSLGYFVIPANVEKTDAAELAYYETFIKPNLTDQGTAIGTLRLKQEYTIFPYINGVGAPQAKNLATKNLIPGQTFQIGGDSKTFNAGDRVVLFMCPDSYNTSTKEVEIYFNSTSPTNTSTTTTKDKQLFFMHKYLNKETGVKYGSGYGDFAGCQMMSFYASDCQSMVITIEDIHTQHQYLDYDFNDIILTVSDNPNGFQVQGFKPPQWAIGNNGGVLKIVPTEDLYK